MEIVAALESNNSMGGDDSKDETHLDDRLTAQAVSFKYQS